MYLFFHFYFDFKMFNNSSAISRLSKPLMLIHLSPNMVSFFICTNHTVIGMQPSYTSPICILYIIQSFLLYFFCSARVTVLTDAAFVLVCPSCPSCIHYTSERVAVRPFFFRKACGQQDFYCLFHFIIHYSTLSTLIGSPLSLQVNVSPR